jgi:hypothetical protein
MKPEIYKQASEETKTPMTCLTYKHDIQMIPILKIRKPYLGVHRWPQCWEDAHGMLWV